VSITQVGAAERFDSVAFSSETIDGAATSMYTHYRCPRCGELIQFAKRDFEHRAPRRLSNLPGELAREIDAWAAQAALREAPFLDWVCPTCGLAARVYVQPWAGGRHGDHGVDLLTVVECMQDERHAP
jgi:predicted RNA-binding Zn-ribbon protein involved in translation (DUF1610 family)